MSMSDLNQTLAAGLAASTPTSPGSVSPEQELARLKSLCAELLADRERLRGALVTALDERDRYLKSLCAALREDVSFTREDVFASLGSGASLEQIIKEFKAGKPTVP